jgi:hypothetical protein
MRNLTLETTKSSIFSGNEALSYSMLHLRLVGSGRHENKFGVGRFT